MDKEQIKRKILQALKSEPQIKDIKSVAIFGSYVNSKPSESSDVDVLIEFEPTSCIGLFEFVGLKESLSAALGKEVDLVTPGAISKYFRDEVLRQAELIYEK
jgi:hypothetical protein